jgi:hypothetical protein
MGRGEAKGKLIFNHRPHGNHGLLMQNLCDCQCLPIRSVANLFKFIHFSVKP